MVQVDYYFLHSSPSTPINDQINDTTQDLEAFKIFGEDLGRGATSTHVTSREASTFKIQPHNLSKTSAQVFGQNGSNPSC